MKGIIIGIGWGAEQSHYTRKPFWDVKISKFVRVNRCNKCGRDIPKGWRYCNVCKKKNRLRSQRKWRKSKRTNGR